MISSGLLIAPPGEIERRVQGKMTRQKVLAREDPLTLDVILDEAAVLRKVGDAHVMRGQLTHLAAMAVQPTSASRCFRWKPGLTPQRLGSSPSWRSRTWWPRTWCTWTNMTSDLYVEQEAEVYRYGMAFDRLRALAVPSEKSAEFLATAADTMK